MTDYDGVKGLLPHIVDAAIIADMKYRGYHPNNPDDPDGGFQYTTAPMTTTGEATTYKISGPSSGGHATATSSGITQDVNSSVLGFSPNKDVYHYWPTAIHDLFDPWLKIPEPSVFDDKIAHVAKAAKLLLVNGEETDDGKGYKVGNDNLDDIDTMNQKLAGMHGNAVAAFQHAWAEHIPSVLHGQAGMAAALSIAISADKALYGVARKNVASLADQALAAFKAAGEDSTDAHLVINIVTQGLAIAAFAAATGGAGAVIEGVAGGAALAAGVASSFLPSDDPKKKVPLGDRDPHTVLRHVSDAFDKVTNSGATTEIDLANLLDKIDTQAEDNIAAGKFGFRLGSLRSDRAGEQADIDHLDEASSWLKMDRDAAHQVGDVLMPNIALQFDEAAIEAQNALGSDPWIRPSEVSYSANGFYGQFSLSLDFLTNLLDDTSTQLTRAGELFSLAADEISDQDGASDQQMHKLLKQLEQGSGTPTQDAVHSAGETYGAGTTETNDDRQHLRDRLHQRLDDPNESGMY